MAELVETLVVGWLGCNCSIVVEGGGRRAVVIDPGDEAERILEVVRAHGLEIVAITHTHAHIDHVMATGALARACGAPVLLHQGDEPLYRNLAMQAAMLGLPGAPEAPPIDRWIGDGDRIELGSASLDVLFTPGHTPGSTCFHDGPGARLFTGDTLFRRSIGRTDLWGGSMPQLVDSIRSKLYTLPGDTVVVPGHGPVTTISEERRHNPFVTA